MISCCDCDEPLMANFTYKNLSIEHLDNSGTEPISTNESVLKTAYGIRLTINREEIANLNHTKFLFMQSAYAISCDDCAEKKFLPKDSITSIRIITLNDFDENHPADSDISAYFKVYKFRVYSTISEHIETFLNHYINYPSQFESEDDFLLMNAPTINTQHAFKIEIHLSDGTILEQQTTPINLI